jgi:hypothetical protein
MLSLLQDLYLPLREDVLEVRVMLALPLSGSSGSSPNYTLKHVFPLQRIRISKSDGNRNDYIALSYTWGDSNDTLLICIDGHLKPVTLANR